jgi:hypothetical protein
MQKGLTAVVVGLVLFIVVKQLVATLVTGTDTGSQLIQNILALAVAIGVVLMALNTFLKGD